MSTHYEVDMKMIKTIPAFPVLNIDEAVKFYTAKFGFTCKYSNTGFAKLLRDEIELHLWKSNDESWKKKGTSFIKNPVCSGAESFLAGTHSCRVQVDEIDKLYTELKQTGVLYNSKTVVEETDWETKEFPSLDLHRNLLTFFERI